MKGSTHGLDVVRYSERSGRKKKLGMNIKDVWTTKKYIFFLTQIFLHTNFSFTHQLISIKLNITYGKNMYVYIGVILLNYVFVLQ